MKRGLARLEVIAARHRKHFIREDRSERRSLFQNRYTGCLTPEGQRSLFRSCPNFSAEHAAQVGSL